MLHAVLRVNEGCELLSKVDCLIDGNLGCLILVFLKQESESLDDEVPWCVVSVQGSAVLKHCIVFAELRKEIMKRLDSSGTKDFVKDGDFSEQFTSDLLETTGQFSNICKSHLQIVA